jgi:hypothetical protein
VNQQSGRFVCVQEDAVRGKIAPRAIREFGRAMDKFWRSLPPVLALILALPLIAAAQGSAVRARVTDRVDLSQLTTLKGNTHPLARAQYDQGAAPASLPMNRMMLILQRSPDQESALQDLLTQQQISSSPSFHKWLTPDQFGQQFGPADADIQAVTSWLASFGFQNIKVSRGRVTIEFSGTASQVETALHTPIHRYVVNGESHWANANDPQIPAALAPVVTGVVSLHNFRPKPTIRTIRKKSVAKVKPGEKPQIDFSDGSHGLVPADFNKIYNVGAGMTGAGVTIGIVTDTNINVQDINDFRSMFGAPSNPPAIILNGPDPGVLVLGGAEGEAVLDVTWAGAVAPAATVDLVVSEDTDASQGTDLSEVYIVDNNSADVMTESFSTCESQLANAGMLTGTNGAAAFYGGLAEQAAAQGITYLVSSGDGGPDTCDDQTTVPTTDSPASVNLLAATPFNVAVGGTEFVDCTPVPGCVDSSGTYWQATNGANFESAKSYIPEKVWNESCITTSPTGCNTVGLWSSGGGQSIAFPKPVWQAGVSGIPSANARFLPDVSLAAADHDGYVICVDGLCQGNNPTFSIASGTSASVQAFGGIMALVVQKLGGSPAGRVGNANYVLYKLAASENLASCNASNVPPASPPANTCIFNDVTLGNTNIPGETGFAAGTGYDEATGLGSVNVTNLVNQWHTAQSAGTTTTLTLNSGNAVNITHGQSVSVGVTVGPTPPATGAPSGDVSLIAANIGSGQGADFFSLTQNGTSSSASWSTNFLPGGTNYSVKAHYSGDGTFLGSDSAAVNVTVNPEASLTLAGIINESSSAAFCATETSFVYGSPYILTVGVVDAAHGTGPVCQPTPSGAFPSGNVSVTLDGVPLGTGLFALNGNGFFEDQAIQLTSGTHTILASYQGDNSFSASASPTSLTVTVAKASTTLSVGANPTNPSVGGSVTLTATVTTASNATANASQEPTGTVQFFNGATAIGSPATVTGGVAASGFAQAIGNIQTSALPQGNNSITATYSGDGNFVGNTSPAITVSVGVAAINVSSCGTAISVSTPGQSGTCLITVTGANGFAGTVTLGNSVLGLHSADVHPPACSFGAPDQAFTAPNTITLSSTTTTGNATMTCTTTAVSGIMVRPSGRPSGRGWPFAAMAIALAGFLFLVTARRQRRWSLIPLSVLLAVVVLAGVSCSGGGSSGTGGGNPGTTPDTYTVTVTATPNSGTAQTTTVSVVVQ